VEICLLFYRIIFARAKKSICIFIQIFLGGGPKFETKNLYIESVHP